MNSQKISIQNSSISLLSKKDEKSQEYSNKFQLKSAIKTCETDEKPHHFSFHSNDFKLLKKDFQSFYKKIEAAGGVVFNAENEMLMIHRLGVWDLPKGKMEKGETPEESALREVEEECGISGLQLQSKITNTFHTYILKDNRILKKTYWFLMKIDGKPDLIPQTEEDILEAKWCSKKEVEENLKNSYENIRVVLKTVGEK